jgi:hypothetical protein
LLQITANSLPFCLLQAATSLDMQQALACNGKTLAGSDIAGKRSNSLWAMIGAEYWKVCISFRSLWL